MELTNLISYLNEIDTTVFLFFNGIHAPFWDIFMKTFTGTPVCLIDVSAA